METAIEHTLSDVLRTPKPVLREAERRDVLITRRGPAGDMVLMEAKRARALRDTLGSVARLLNFAVRIEGVESRLAEIVNLALPWTSYLPAEERSQFVAELAEMAGASAETGNYTPLALLLRDWQMTALVYADPVAFKAVTEPLEETELPSLLTEKVRREYSKAADATEAAARAPRARKATKKKARDGAETAAGEPIRRPRAEAVEA